MADNLNMSNKQVYGDRKYIRGQQKKGLGSHCLMGTEFV